MYNLYYIVPFDRCGIVISWRLCGKKLKFKYKKKFDAEILFPNIIENGDGWFKLDNPLPLNDYGIGLSSESWGEVQTKYTDQKTGNILEWKVILKAIAIRINYQFDDLFRWEKYSNEKRQSIILNKRIRIKEELEKYVNNIIQYLFSFSNESIRMYRSLHNIYIQTDSVNAYYNPINQMWESFPQCSILIDKTYNDVLKNNTLRFCINNAYKGLSLQYSLLSNAYDNYNRQDYRNTILCLATCIETSIITLLTNYWNSNNISNRKRENYLKENSGFCKLYKLIEKLGLPVNKRIMVYKKVMDPRNKIIHSGEKPTREIAEEACKETKLFIEFHKIPIFS